MMMEIDDRLQKFAAQGIGLRNDEVRLVAFHTQWQRLFSAEAHFIFDALRNESLRLYHCGSTPVSGLEAKPIIDILGSVSSLEDLDNQRIKFESIGYDCKGEFGIKGRRFFVLQDPNKTTTFVHLHVFRHGDFEIEKHFCFRDYLRASPDVVKVYQQHKRHLIDHLKISRESYPAAKNDLIAQLQSEAESRIPSQKILAILSAARGHRNTMDFLQEVYAEGSIEILDLNELEIGPYSYAQASNDQFQSVVQKILASDLLVLATPVYWYSMASEMKLFLDRFSNLLSGNLKHLGEGLCGKRVIVCSTGSDLQLPLGFEVPFSNTAVYFGMDYLGAIYKSIK